jgi:beta-glucosidase/6-phospho-beta-glucosidase/beta-galactosidase
VTGYFVWSLTDSFEWTSGYTLKMGLFYVDMGRGERTRYPRSSAHFYAMLTGARGFTPVVRDYHACK